MFGLGSLRILASLLLAHGVDRKYLLKFLRVLAISFCTAPLRIFEKVKFGREIERQEVGEPPIFILGHWRSGTTHLVNVMSQDKNLGWVSTFQAFAPEFFLTGERLLVPFLKKWLPGILERLVPKRRFMDNMEVSLDYPQEEEFALGNISRYSLYHGSYYFSRNLESYFRKYVLFEGVSEGTVTAWKNAYMKILKKATYRANGKRLILKNPPNTARIKILLEMFPDAKFIHISRNPYVVFKSRVREYEGACKEWGFQEISREEIEANVLYIYKEVMQKFFEGKDLIPEGNYVGVKFEDFEADPVGELRRVYRELNLAGFEEAEGNFRAYMEGQKTYQKNAYVLDEETREKIYQHWKVTIEQWGCDVPESLRQKVEV